MLVLTRKFGEEIVIGSGDDAIRVVVCKGNGHDRVKLAIDAPREIPIRRGELDSTDE